MRVDHGLSVALVLVLLSLPSCSQSQGEVALGMDQADHLSVLWYPCSTKWNATEARLFRLDGRFLGDGQDELITSTKEFASTDSGDSVVWNARLPTHERLDSEGRYAVDVTGSNFGVYLDFRASQLPSDRWLTREGPLSRSDYLRVAADSCHDDDVTLLVLMFLVIAIGIPLAAGRIFTARSAKRGSLIAAEAIPPRRDLPIR